MPHIWKSCTTKLAKNTDGYKIRLQSVGRNSISGWRVNFIPIRRNTRTGRGGFGPCARAHRVCTPPQPRTCQHGVQKSGRTVLRFRFAAGRRGKIVPFGRLFERFATSLFELSISWQISAFPYSYFIFPSYPFSLFFPPLSHPFPPPPLLSRPRPAIVPRNRFDLERRNSVSFRASNLFTILRMERLNLSRRWWESMTRILARILFVLTIIR